MIGPAAVLDACTLVPIRLATTMLWLADAGLFQPLWSDQILDEVRRNLPKVRGMDEERARHRVNLMRTSFGGEALVDGFDQLIETMRCDAKDRHVLAAAVQSGADAIVTFNLKDFPDESTRPYDLHAIHPDLFLTQLLREKPTEVLAAVQDQVATFRRPPATLGDFLDSLAVTAPTFAEQMALVAGPQTGAI